MWKAEITVVSVLTVCLCGCPDATNESPKATRTGSLGVTTQDIDDLAKPDPQQKIQNGPGGNAPANQ
jgi:hypothetical protein